MSGKQEEILQRVNKILSDEEYQFALAGDKIRALSARNGDVLVIFNSLESGIKHLITKEFKKDSCLAILRKSN